MKHLRKSILTLLALTLFGGAGAWAQGPTQVTQITADMIASWQGVNEYITLADLQDLGFEATDLATAQAWTGAPQSGTCYLFYAISGSNIAYVYFTAGSVNDHDNGELVKSDLYNDVAKDYKYFYTGAPNQAIELTKSGANQWTLGQTPDYDLELQVEYYEAHALKDIPAGWTVMVNGIEQQTPYQGDSLMITETDSVTLVPANPRRVKSVTLEDEVTLQTVHIGGLIDVTVYYMPGDTWEDAIARPENTGFEWDDNGDISCNGKYIFKGGDWVNKSHFIVPNANYEAELI